MVVRDFVNGSVVTDENWCFDKYKHIMDNGEQRTALHNAINDAILVGRNQVKQAITEEETHLAEMIEKRESEGFDFTTHEIISRKGALQSIQNIRDIFVKMFL